MWKRRGWFAENIREPSFIVDDIWQFLGATRFSEVGQKRVTMLHSKVRRSLKHSFQ
ncbi:hypothetical protein [Nostoc sp. DSM 114161]|uniref:hypothetical protein n=1 Tax=Nostoc sp. DSM 114161 TaxID=3440143 RepID=UPI004045A591